MTGCDTLLVILYLLGFLLVGLPVHLMHLIDLCFLVTQQEHFPKSWYLDQSSYLLPITYVSLHLCKKEMLHLSMLC